MSSKPDKEYLNAALWNYRKSMELRTKVLDSTDSEKEFTEIEWMLLGHLYGERAAYMRFLVDCAPYQAGQFAQLYNYCALLEMRQRFQIKVMSIESYFKNYHSDRLARELGYNRSTAKFYDKEKYITLLIKDGKIVRIIGRYYSFKTAMNQANKYFEKAVDNYASERIQAAEAF